MAVTGTNGRAARAGASAAVAAIAALLLCGTAADAKVFFKETFDDGDAWESRWTKSSWKQSEGTAGDFVRTAGKFPGDDGALSNGVQTTPDASFYAMTSSFDEVVDTKDSDLVVQFSVKHEQSIDCGGGYIKILPASVSDKQIKAFGGDVPYSIMFGPDVCGSTKRTHVILANKKDGEGVLKRDDVKAVKTDTLTHVYTLVIKPDNAYQVLIDLEEVASGSIEEDWDFLPPKMIDDPDATQPEDWDDRPMIPDETDVKPEDWDQPEFVEDVNARKPEE